MELNSDCKKLTIDLKDIRNRHEKFIGFIRNRQVTDAILTKLKIESMYPPFLLIGERYQNERRYEIKLRQELGKKLHAQFVGEFHNGLAIVHWGRLAFFIDRNGNKKSDGFVSASPFSEGKALIREQNATSDPYSFLDSDMHIIPKHYFMDAKNFSNGYAAVQQARDSWIFVDHNFEPLKDSRESQYQFNSEPKSFSEGLAAVPLTKNFTSSLISSEETWGFIGTNGRRRTVESYLGARSFSEGLAAVKTEQGWHFIKGNEEKAIDGIFEETGDFQNGLAPVKKLGFWYFIDKTGRNVFDKLYVSASNFNAGYAVVQELSGDKESNYLINAKGKRVLGPYHKIERFDGGLVRISRDGRSNEYVDLYGNKVF